MRLVPYTFLKCFFPVAEGNPFFSPTMQCLFTAFCTHYEGGVMVLIEGTLWCDGCGVEITWAPVISGTEHYCCQSCLEGHECDCAAQQEMEDDRRAGNESAPSLPLA
jgi:hypothetical protein